MTRTVHDDTAGRELTEAELELQSALIDAETHVGRAIVRLGNLLEKRDDLARPPWLLRERNRDLATWARTLAAVRKEQGL